MDEEQEAELEESVASARLTSNAGSNAGVAAGPLALVVHRPLGSSRLATLPMRSALGALAVLLVAAAVEEVEADDLALVVDQLVTGCGRRHCRH